MRLQAALRSVAERASELGVLLVDYSKPEFSHHNQHWSYEEMSGIDPSIVVHEIKTYPSAKPIRKKIRQVHPRKAATIKAEIEKLLKSGFIYPIPMTK